MVEFCRCYRQELLLCAQSQWIVSKNFEKTSGKLPQGQGLTSTVRTEGPCYSAGKNLFPGLVDHSFDTTAEDNHQHFVKMAAGIYWTIRMNQLVITYSLGGGQVTRLESPTDRSLPMPSTVATESGLVCVCLQGCDVHSKHMQKKRHQHQLVWRPWLVSRYSTVQKCSHQANWAAALLCRYECVREWCVWWTGICPACFLTLIWWVLA